MQKLAEVIRPKFEIVEKTLSEALDGTGAAHWTKPNGGYFITLYMKIGSAKRVYDLMKGAGVVLTPAGATHPHGVDPSDSILRLAPTYPSSKELQLGCEVLEICVRLAAVEALLK